MLRREVAIFLVVGGITVLIDYLSYRLLTLAGLKPVGLAKSLGFIAGTAFAYVANRRLTFSARHQPLFGTLWRFGVLYLLTLGANVLVNSLVLQSLASSSYAVSLAFIAATATSATLNFVGMKHFVFDASELRGAA